MAVRTGLEPATSCVTARHPNQLNYRTIYNFQVKMEEERGFEPLRGLTRLSVFKTDPFSRTWVFLQINSGMNRML